LGRGEVQIGIRLGAGRHAEEGAGDGGEQTKGKKQLAPLYSGKVRTPKKNWF